MQPEEYYRMKETATGKKAPAYDVAARNLQREVMESEKEQLDNGADQYSEKEVRQATVHTRADVVLMCSYLQCITGLLRSIDIVLWVIAALLAVLVGKYLFFS
jgi:hypothetical protein